MVMVNFFCIEILLSTYIRVVYVLLQPMSMLRSIIEIFFLIANDKVTGARLYRAASVWTAGLGHEALRNPLLNVVVAARQ